MVTYTMPAPSGCVVEPASFFIHGDLAANTVSLAEANAGVADEAEVVPMCGCPVEPGYYWNVDSYEVAALVKRGETLLGRCPLRYANTSRDFAGTLPVQLAGRYDVSVYAHDPASGNTGVDHLTLTVTEE